MIVETAGGDELKIMDFGLAKVLDSGTGATESVSVAGTAMGTLGYMAPEVLNGGVVDERADLFAIGVMVVETLVGARPFGGQNPHEILTAVLQSHYHLQRETTEIRALDAVVQRCLAKDPRDRYSSAAELSKDLIPALARCEGPPPRHGSIDARFANSGRAEPPVGTQVIGTASSRSKSTCHRVWKHVKLCGTLLTCLPRVYED